MTQTLNYIVSEYTLDVPGYGYIKVSSVREVDKWMTFPHPRDGAATISGLAKFFSTPGEALAYGHEIAERIHNGDL